MHLSIFILIINQLDAKNFCFTISLFHASTCFEHMCSSSGCQNCITQPLVSSHLQVCSKHVEEWNKLIVKQKFCPSSWLITEINILSLFRDQRTQYISNLRVIDEFITQLQKVIYLCLIRHAYKFNKNYQLNTEEHYRLMDILKCGSSFL